MSHNQERVIPVAVAILLRGGGSGATAWREGGEGTDEEARVYTKQNGGAPSLLITKRLSHTPYGGYWEFPGGKLEPGESPSAAAERECLEELGVRVRIEAELPALVHRYEHATVRLHPCVGAMVDPDAEVRHLGVSAHRWVGLDELPWLEFLPANVRLITRLVRWLGGREDGAGGGASRCANG
jgi:8-oxo-dGTP diphosphatase